MTEQVEESIHEAIIEENDHSQQPDESALFELNLIMVLLSLNSTSNDDCLSFVEEREKIVRENEARLDTKRKDRHKVKFEGQRPPPRFQPIKDIR